MPFMGVGMPLPPTCARVRQHGTGHGLGAVPYSASPILRRGDPCGRPPSCAHVRQTAEQCSALRRRRTSLRRGRRPRRPAVPRPLCHCEPMRLASPARGGVTGARAGDGGVPPVLRRGDPCGRPPSPPSSVGAIHESPTNLRPCPTNGRAMLGPTVQTPVSSVGGGALDAPPSPDPLSLRSSAPCLPLRGPWVCPSAHTGAVGVPLTKEVCRGSPFSHLRIIASLQKARTSSTAPSSPRTCSE